MLHNFDFNIAVISILIILLASPYSYKEEKRFRKTICFSGYTLSGMDRDSMPDFFIQKRGHLLSPRYTINSPQKS